LSIVLRQLSGIRKGRMTAEINTRKKVPIHQCQVISSTSRKDASGMWGCQSRRRSVLSDWFFNR
jgi:hypothetical protein